jgi:hypothetical protein
MAGKLEVEGKEILIKSSNGTMAVIPKDKVSMVKGYIDSGNHEMVDKFVNTLKEFKHDNQKAGDGLYANIHAKRQRIAAGSGERMRKPGEAGAPTADQFKQAAKTAKAKDGMCISPMSTMKQKAADGVKITPPAKRKPIVVTNPKDPRLKAYQDSSFIKKNFNIFPHPKGYDQALKRVGQHPESDYFPAPKQPVIYKEPIQKKPSPPKSGGSTEPVEKPKPVLVKPKFDLPESTPRPIIKKGGKIKSVQPVEKEITPPDTTSAKPVVPEKVTPEKVTPADTTATEKKTTPVEKPTPKKMPKAIMPTRQGGWSKQPLLMRLFPKLYKK